jgi:hypothetical protein
MRLCRGSAVAVTAWVCSGWSRLDQVELIELLPKLAATVPKTDRAALKNLQRKCEPAFTEMMSHGVCTTVRAGGISQLQTWLQLDSCSWVNVDAKLCQAHVHEPAFGAVCHWKLPKHWMLGYSMLTTYGYTSESSTHHVYPLSKAG